ncbi:hypothetical protein PVAND_017783, partial [Polypedilum vanderplanki]
FTYGNLVTTFISSKSSSLINFGKNNRNAETSQRSPPEISLNNSSVIATGGVYKDQGRNQCKLVTHTY